MDNFKNIDKFIRFSNKKHNYKILLSITEKTFVQMDQYQAFNFKNLPRFVFLKIKQLYMAQMGIIYIDKNRIIHLPIGKIYLLYCAGVFVGYVFEFPRFEIKVKQNVIKLNKSNFVPSEIENSKEYFKNQHFYVVGDGDSFINVILNERKYFNIYNR